MIGTLDETPTATPASGVRSLAGPPSDDSQLAIALRRILAEADPVDPQAPVACFNSAF